MDPASLWQSDADQEWVGIIESSGANPLVEAVCHWKMMPACHLSLSLSLSLRGSLSQCSSDEHVSHAGGP